MILWNLYLCQVVCEICHWKLSPILNTAVFLIFLLIPLHLGSFRLEGQSGLGWDAGFPKKPYICHVCGKTMKTKGAIARHIKNVHERRRDWMCDLCPKAFLERSVRDDHRRTHTGECPFVCHTCGKSFKTAASLSMHSKLHSDSFPHRCTYCPGKFRWKSQLNGHILTHTGEKRHKCDICGKAFTVKCDLNRHAFVHSTVKSHYCPICDATFSQKRYLTKHVKARHAAPSILKLIKSTDVRIEKISKTTAEEEKSWRPYQSCMEVLHTSNIP